MAKNRLEIDVILDVQSQEKQACFPDYGCHLSMLHFILEKIINLWLEIFFYTSGHPLLKGIPSPSVMTVAIFCLEFHAHQEVHGVSLLGHGTWKRLHSGQKP